MNTEKPQDAIREDDIGYESELARAHQPAPVARTGRLSGGLALILSTITLCASAYLWYALVYQRPELLQTDLPGAIARLDNAARELREALDQTDENVDQLRETQETLKGALDKVQSDLSRNRTEWVISEAEQLLLAANRRLQLARDVNSALAALRAADRQLELLSNPNLLPVRRQLAREIAMVESLERADIAGISLKLGSLAEGTDRLPLAQELRAATEQAPPVDAAVAPRGVWRDLLGLVRVRRHDTTPKPLLAPEQQYYARENLRLMLYGAQHAVLQGNLAAFHQNLGAASRTLRDHYDPQAPAVLNALVEIEKMRAAPIMAELPDIAASLELLRRLPGRRRNP